MAHKLVNRARMTVSGTPGTGNVTLNAPVVGFRSLAVAGLVNGDTFSYLIEDGTNWELGRGTYSSTGPSFTRDVVFASSAGGTTKITASPAAIVGVSALAEDLNHAQGFAEVLSNVDKLLGVNEAWSALNYQTITWAATINIDHRAVHNGIITATGNTTLGTTANQAEKQGSSGSFVFIHSGAARTLSFNTTYWKTAEGAALDLSTTAGARDLIGWHADADGKNLLWVAALAMA